MNLGEGQTTISEDWISIENCIGDDEDEECCRDGCEGWIEYEPVECYCAVSPRPPCGNCENSGVWCPECGWRERNE